MSGLGHLRGLGRAPPRRPVPHSFRYRVFLPLFDLDELPERARSDSPVVGPPAGARAVPLRATISAATAIRWRTRARNLARDRLGRRPAGPVRLLANPRYLGVGFNPVSFLFLLRQDGAVEA